MFEDSILISAPTGRKAGALFASFLAQIAAVGVLIVVPLIFHDTLPGVRMALPSPFILSPLPKAPDPPQEKPSAPSARPIDPMVRVFLPQAPTARVIPSSDAIIVTNLEAPSLGAGYAPPGAIFSPGSNLGTASTLPPPDPPKPTPAPAAAAPKPDAAPIPVGGDVQSAKLIKKVMPSYPDPARRLRISGTVHLVGIIGKDGTIQNLQVMSGNPFLTQAALDAVRQWVYRPTLLDHQPVEVIAPIDVIFALTQ